MKVRLDTVAPLDTNIHAIAIAKTNKQTNGQKFACRKMELISPLCPRRQLK